MCFFEYPSQDVFLKALYDFFNVNLKKMVKVNG